MAASVVNIDLPKENFFFFLICLLNSSIPMACGVKAAVSEALETWGK